MTTRASITRSLRNRVSDIGVIQINYVSPFIFKVSFSIKGNRSFEEVSNDVRTVLKKTSAAAVGYELEQISASDTLIIDSAPSNVSLASFTSDQSIVGLQETLVLVVHDLAKLYFEEVLGSGVKVWVGKEDGSAPPEFLERVKVALQNVGFAGLNFEVKAVDEHVLSLLNARPKRQFIPSRNNRLVQYTEEDEHLYANRIFSLVEGNTNQIGLIDNENGNKLYLTSALDKLSVGSMVPLYSRIFVDMPLKNTTEDYFESSFGLTQNEFMQFCRAGRLVPVFNKNLGYYPESVWRTWLEDSSLAFISPRDADYLAMRYLWNSSPFLSIYRDTNNNLIPILDEARTQILDSGGPTFRQNKWIYDVLGWIKYGAEEFEGIAFHRGKESLASLSAGGVSAHLLASGARFHSDVNLAEVIASDSFMASQNIGMSQAFGASLYDNHVLNPNILASMVPLFQQATEVQGQLQAQRITELVHSLELHYSPQIPVAEYIDILSDQETVRVSALVNQLLNGIDTQNADHELRDRVIKLNMEVSKLDKKNLTVSTVDVLGDTASWTAAATGNLPAFGMVLLGKFLAASVSGELVSRGERALLDGPAAAAIDRFRGAINGVSPQAVRLFRIRNKLDKK